MKPPPTMLIAAATTIVASSFAFAQSPHGPSEGDVLTYHGAADRSGTYKVQGLTWDRAKSVISMRLFDPTSPDTSTHSRSTGARRAGLGTIVGGERRQQRRCFGREHGSPDLEPLAWQSGASLGTEMRQH
jgi:hypothetical protein